MLRIEDPYGALSEQEIAEAEAKLGTRFPESYRDLLRTTGGGAMESYEIPGSSGSAMLNEFYDIEALIFMQHGGSNQVIPHEFIAIGRGGGGALCIQVEGDGTGSIWWADYDLANARLLEEPSHEVMHKLADSFDEFAAML